MIAITKDVHGMWGFVLCDGVEEFEQFEVEHDTRKRRVVSSVRSTVFFPAVDELDFQRCSEQPITTGNLVDLGDVSTLTLRQRW